MIEVHDAILIGGSEFAHHVGTEDRFDAALNVAFDLKSVEFIRGIEYAHVGLVDGPGNEVIDYCAAILCLRALVRRHDKVLVYDHNGSRALVVALMMMNLDGGQWRPNPTSWSHWPTWKERFELASDRARPGNLPEVHPFHTEMFDKMPWGLLEVL